MTNSANIPVIARTDWQKCEIRRGNAAVTALPLPQASPAAASALASTSTKSESGSPSVSVADF